MANPIIIGGLLTASGAGAIGIAVSGPCVIAHVDRIDATTSIRTDPGALASVYGNQFDPATVSGSGVLQYLPGDRAAWNALDYQTRHANDIDAASGIHHTLLYLSSMFVSNELTNGSIFVGGSDNLPHQRAMSGDASISNTGAVTLTTVNADVGTFGDDTHIAQITVDAKGRITAIGDILFAHAGEHIELVVSGLIPSDPVLTPDGSDFIYGYVAD